MPSRKAASANREHNRWSAEFAIRKGVAMGLARAHWMQDIAGIIVAEPAPSVPHRHVADTDVSLEQQALGLPQ